MALVAVIYLRRKELRASCCCSVFIARLADSDNPSYFGDFSNYSQCQGQSVFAFVFVFVFVIDLYLQNCLLYITSTLANSQTHPNVRVNALFYCEFLYFKYFAFEALQMSVVMRCARLAVSNNCAFLGGAHQMPAFWKLSLYYFAILTPWHKVEEIVHHHNSDSVPFCFLKHCSNKYPADAAGLKSDDYMQCKNDFLL